VWLTPETCTVNLLNNRLLCVASHWTIINICIYPIELTQAEGEALHLTLFTLKKSICLKGKNCQTMRIQLNPKTAPSVQRSLWQYANSGGKSNTV